MTANDRQTDAAPTGARSAVRRLIESIARKPYVQGLPEWDLFPDDETRRKAIESVEKSMMPRSIKGVLGFLIAVVLFLSVPLLVSYLIAGYALPVMGAWNKRIMWIMALTGYTVIVYLAIRRDMPKALRQKLVEAGVPVCLACGYGLRGLPGQTERCPECGKKIDERARALMAAASHDESDDPTSRMPAAAPGSEPAR